MLITPPGEIDHIDGDGTNNRLDNLREVSHKNNQKNMKRLSNNTTGCTGVVWLKYRKMWEARIYVGKKIIGLGSYKNFEDAVSARKRGEAEHGFHPNHGSDRPL